MDYIFGTSKQYYVRKDRREKERLEIEQKVNKVLAQGTVKKQA